MSSFDTLLFCCAICQRDVRDYPNRNGRERNLEPLCRSCESRWNERIRPPQGGDFMDRRKVMQISALSHALHNTASIKQWDAQYASA